MYYVRSGGDLYLNHPTHSEVANAGVITAFKCVCHIKMLCEDTLSAVVAPRASGGCRNHPATANSCFMEAVNPGVTGAVALSHDVPAAGSGVRFMFG